jgi:hypothetical protein
MNQPEQDPSKSFRTKVTEIFREFVGERAEILCSGLCDGQIYNRIADALVSESDIGEEVAKDIGFHLSDWHSDAAFIVALHLFPERFTPAEIEAGTADFLMHAPNHFAAAATLYGFPVDDIFDARPQPLKSQALSNPDT